MEAHPKARLTVTKACLDKECLGCPGFIEAVSSDIIGAEAGIVKCAVKNLFWVGVRMPIINVFRSNTIKALGRKPGCPMFPRD